MDRSKWEYKKLKDVCVSIDDGDWIESQDQSSEGIRLIQTGNIGIGEYLDKSDKAKYISEDTFERLKCKEIFCGDCLISRLPDPIGRACILPDMSDRMITAVDCSIVRFKDIIVPDFFVHYTKSRNYNSDINKHATGATRKRISRKNLEGVMIPAPPVADQQRIVAELDCLNEMIALKQEQLKEFNKLALAIFHDMFGDSVINSKGWPTDKIENVISEKSYRGTINNEDGQVWLLNLDMVESNTGRILEKLFVSTEKTDGSVTTFNEEYVLYSKLRPYLNKVVLPDSSGYCTTELVTLLPNKDKLNRYYVAYLLRSESFVNYICGKVAGAKMPRVSMKEFRIFSIPLPPLALQQQFAEKIQAIEAQKELVKKSIAETQHLLDSRMDLYFD